MNRLIKRLDDINEYSGSFFSWATVALVLLIAFEVLLRYIFKYSVIWLSELENYFFVFCFLITAGYAFKHDKHVRVDLFYSRFSNKRKAWIDLIGGIFLLLPWSGIIVFYTFQFAQRSFIINERSAQPGGLPMLYLLKFALFIGFFLLFLQGLANVLKSIKTIRNKH